MTVQRIYCICILTLNVVACLTVPFMDVSLVSPLLESKSASTSKENHEVKKSSESRADGVDTETSQIPDEEKKPRCYTGIPAPSTVPPVNPLRPIFPTVVDPVQSQMFAALQALKVLFSNSLDYCELFLMCLRTDILTLYRLLNLMLGLMIYVHAVNSLVGWFLQAMFYRGR